MEDVEHAIDTPLDECRPQRRDTVHWLGLNASTPQRLEDVAAGVERDVAFGRRAAHEDGDAAERCGIVVCVALNVMKPRLRARERSGHPFQPVGARSLHQHGDIRCQASARRRDEIVDVLEPFASGPKRLGGEFDRGPDREQALDTGGPCVAADLRVQLVGGEAEFHHVAQHEPARRLEGTEAHRVRP